MSRRSMPIRWGGPSGAAVCLLLCAAGAAAVAPESAGPRLAYLDPGTGSLILQAVVASLAGAAVAFRSYREKILAFFGRGPRETDASEDSTRDE
jgi:hypothetical protein